MTHSMTDIQMHTDQINTMANTMTNTMTTTDLNQNGVISAIEERTSNRHYDESKALTENEVLNLVRLATLAPSAYNRQNWKFVAVHSDSAKQKLQSLAYNQSQITQSSVTFIVCGILSTHKGLDKILEPSVAQSLLPAGTAQAWVDAVNMSHGDNQELQRDEAIRSASLASMTLMLAAQGLGLSSGPMTGFEGDKVSEEFSLDSDELPVMLITVGYNSRSVEKQKHRIPAQDVCVFA